MTISWVLNALSLFLVATGVLLIFLYLWKVQQFAEQWLSPEGKAAYARHRRLLLVAVGLLGAWSILQYLPIIL